MRSTQAGGRTFYLGAAVTDELRLIRDLCSLDARILVLRDQLRQIPQDLALLDAELARHQGALDQVKQQREGSNKSRRALELEAETANATGKRLQTQLVQVKTNREYSAMLHEIEAAKGAVSALEEKILLEMERQDALAAAEQREQQAFNTASGGIGQQRQELEQRQLVAQARLDTLSAEHQGLMNALPREQQTVYQRIFQGRGGQAVVPVEQRACGGCGAPLPLQLVNEIRKMESLITCETCGRILIWSQEQQESGS